jgi:hypothetical protein
LQAFPSLNLPFAVTLTLFFTQLLVFKVINSYLIINYFIGFNWAKKVFQALFIGPSSL